MRIYRSAIIRISSEVSFIRRTSRVRIREKSLSVKLLFIVIGNRSEEELLTEAEAFLLLRRPSAAYPCLKEA